MFGVLLAKLAAFPGWHCTADRGANHHRREQSVGSSSLGSTTGSHVASIIRDIAEKVFDDGMFAGGPIVDDFIMDVGNFISGAMPIDVQECMLDRGVGRCMLPGGPFDTFLNPSIMAIAAAVLRRRR